MGDSVVSPNIDFQLLLAFQDCFQKDLIELIDIYISDAKKKFATLNKTLAMKNLKNFATAARELRIRSLDIGAVRFSHACLSLEIAVQEMRLESISRYLNQLEQQFTNIETELLAIKKKHQKSTLINLYST